MKRPFKIAAIGSIFLTLFGTLSCTNSDEEQTMSTVTIDFDNAKEITIDPTNIVALETDSNSILADISFLEPVDDKYIVQSQSMVHVFDTNGKYLYDIGRMGNARNEFHDLSSIYYKDDCFHIYDFGQNSLLVYNPAGEWQKTINLTDNWPEDIQHPSKLYSFDGLPYISISSFGGDNISTPLVAFVEEDFSSSTTVPEILVKDGLTFMDNCTTGKDGSLYVWKPLCDSLFVIKDKTLAKTYKIDFGSHAIPEDVAAKDAYERFFYINEQNRQGKHIACMAKYYNVVDEYVYFVCVAPDGNINLCKFSRKDNTPVAKVYSFKLKVDNKKVGPFLKIKDNKVYLSLVDTGDSAENPSLAILNLEAFQ
jgi:hypothetical protein